MKVPADRLKTLLGVRSIVYRKGAGLAETDITLA